ncbi:MAG TPA: dolichyl-phosphate beta-glucosyltransferase [Terriglobia bacterium]|nr:dolichyl-phosphate beta-glucosyltransferase [Terriglobia bacterium]
MVKDCQIDEDGAPLVPGAKPTPPFLSIIVPAYNEALRIGRSLDRIRAYLNSKTFSGEVIVVDDGSADATSDVVRRAIESWPDLRLIVNECNRGKGFSVRRGVLEARGRYALFTDADLSAAIDQSGMLLAALESTEADAAIGSRALQRELIGVHQPLFREWGGIVFNWTVRLFTGLRLRDTQCGLKLFRREKTRRAFEHLKAERFGFDPELLFLIQRWGGRIIEIPVRWDNDPLTRFSVMRDTAQSFREVMMVRWRAWMRQYPPPERRPAPSSAPEGVGNGAL